MPRSARQQRDVARAQAYFDALQSNATSPRHPTPLRSALQREINRSVVPRPQRRAMDIAKAKAYYVQLQEQQRHRLAHSLPSSSIARVIHAPAPSVPTAARAPSYHRPMALLVHDSDDEPDQVLVRPVVVRRSGWNRAPVDTSRNSVAPLHATPTPKKRSWWWWVLIMAAMAWWAVAWTEETVPRDPGIASALLFPEPMEEHIVDPPLCFADHKSDHATDSMAVDVPLHCQNAKHRLVCPNHGHCARGILFRCELSEYFQLSKSGTACVWTPMVRHTARSLHATLVTKSVAAACSLIPTLPHEQSGRLFSYRAVAEELAMGRDLKLLHALTEYESAQHVFVVQTSPVDGSTLIGLHPSQPLSLSASCRVQIKLVAAARAMWQRDTEGVWAVLFVAMELWDDSPPWIVHSVLTLVVVTSWQYLWKHRQGGPN